MDKTALEIVIMEIEVLRAVYSVQKEAVLHKNDFGDLLSDNVLKDLEDMREIQKKVHEDFSTPTPKGIT